MAVRQKNNFITYHRGRREKYIEIHTEKEQQQQKQPQVVNYIYIYKNNQTIESKKIRIHK